MAASQKDRQAKLVTPLGDDKLLLRRMVAQETLSQPYDFEIIALSEDDDLGLDDVVGQHAHVELMLRDESDRYFCGHVSRFSFIGYEGRYAKYHLHLRPWFWILTCNQDSRIFQHETVPAIIKSVCAERGFTDIDDRLTDSYGEREFCVQYRETDFAFLSRLMEEEGIYYYFEHQAGKHTLVLADDVSAHQPFGDYAQVEWHPPDAEEQSEHINSWQVSHSIKSGKYTLDDYDFEKPRAELEARSQMPRPIEFGDFEIFDHHVGDFREVDEGERYARIRLEETQAEFERFRGAGPVRGLIPGYLFELKGYPRDDQNQEYLVISVSHELQQHGWEANAKGTDDLFEYSCALTAMSSAEIFRPRRVTPRPVVYGPQTALVVGAEGKVVHTDKFGRIKVHFHWHRYDEKDENSSCWVRVAQPGAGKGYGIEILPRIGHEVVVEFLEGDPDRPIVTGSVYNEDNRPSYHDKLQDTPSRNLHQPETRWSLRSRSFGNMECNRNRFSEIYFEDKEGEECLGIHAERNLDISVENNEGNWVRGIRLTKIGADRKGDMGASVGSEHVDIFDQELDRGYRDWYQVGLVPDENGDESNGGPPDHAPAHGHGDNDGDSSDNGPNNRRKIVFGTENVDHGGHLNFRMSGLRIASLHVPVAFENEDGEELDDEGLAENYPWGVGVHGFSPDDLEDIGQALRDASRYHGDQTDRDDRGEGFEFNDDNDGAGVVNIVASRKIQLTAPSIDIHHAHQDEEVATCNQRSYEYDSRVHNSYDFTIGPYRDPPHDSCWENPVPPPGRYNATYMVPYDATYHHPYEATYRTTYTANYQGFYLANYTGFYIANYLGAMLNKLLSMEHKLVSLVAKGASIEAKGVSVGFTALKIVDRYGKIEKGKFKFEGHVISLNG